MLMRVEFENSPVLNKEHWKKEIMLWTIVALLLILWLLGFSFSIGGSLIHLLLVVALVVFVINLVSRRRGTV